MTNLMKRLAMMSAVCIGSALLTSGTARADAYDDAKYAADKCLQVHMDAYQLNPTTNNGTRLLFAALARGYVYEFQNGSVNPCGIRNAYIYLADTTPSQSPPFFGLLRRYWANEAARRIKIMYPTCQ